MDDARGFEDNFMTVAAQAARGELGLHRQGLLAVKKGLRTLAEHQVQFYKRVDAALASVEIPDDLSLACGQGCSYCCNYHVHVSAPEAIAIAEHLRAKWRPERVAVAIESLAKNVASVQGLTEEEHTATNVRCAFLSPQDSCSIYDVRPVACRKHHSFDVEPCRVTFDDPTSQDAAPQSLERLAVAHGLFTSSVASMEIEGMDAARYEMSAAVLEALTQPAAIKRWRAGKNSFPSGKNRDTQRAT
ncbi:YkgJ family cysteine cluster protein [Roseateles chitinivorans]|uniref:YkgJ family cysteine cluster protein n=1 Tax=Roseateles chitinivorans TaxID=2917965 RepID=UPI003D676DC2